MSNGSLAPTYLEGNKETPSRHTQQKNSATNHYSDASRHRNPPVKKSPSYYNTTFWAMCCLAFFGFLRVSQFPQKVLTIHLVTYPSATLQSTTGRDLAYCDCSSKGQKLKNGVKVYIGATWTRAMFHAGLKSLIDNLNLDKHCYNTHSFRIGAAASASPAKIPESHIQILSRWGSNAFSRYIRPPPTEIANISKVIAAESQ